MESSQVNSCQVKFNETNALCYPTTSDSNLGQLGVIPIQANLGWSQCGSTWGYPNLGQLGYPTLVGVTNLGRSQFGSTWGVTNLGQLGLPTWVDVINLGWSQFGSTWGDLIWVNLGWSQFGSTWVNHLVWGDQFGSTWGDLTWVNLGWSQFGSTRVTHFVWVDPNLGQIWVSNWLTYTRVIAINLWCCLNWCTPNWVTQIGVFLNALSESLSQLYEYSLLVDRYCRIVCVVFWSD